MTWRHVALGVALTTVLTTPVLTQNLPADLQRAKQREARTGDCKSVLPEYTRVAEQAVKSSRPVAAEALLRAAMCHESVADGQAQAVYRRVMGDFSDQRGPADAARKRLASLTSPPASSQASAAGPFTTIVSPVSVDAVPSPDGTQVLERSEAGTVLRDVKTGKTSMLFPDEDRDGDQVRVRTAWPVFWSPDGREVVYMATVFFDDPPPNQPLLGSELRVLELATRKARTVQSLPPPSGQRTFRLRGWTAGNEILYSEDRRNVGGVDTGDFWLLPRTGGIPSKLFSLPKPENQTRVSSVTPDGRSLVVVRDEHLAVVDLRSGEERPISRGIAAAYPRVSADGRLIAFLSRQDGRWALYVTPFGSGMVSNPVLVSRLDRNRPDPPASADLRWLSDNVSLSLRYSEAEQNLYRLDVDQKTQAVTGAPQRLTRDHDAYKPLISPDGHHIVFTQPGGARDGTLFTVRTDGSGERALAQVAAQPRGAFVDYDWWSADEVAFVRPNTSELLRVKVPSGAVVRAGDVGGPVGDSFSVLRGVDSIVVGRRKNPQDDAGPPTVVRNISTGVERVLTLSSAPNLHVSPNKRFGVWRNLDDELVLVGLEGGKPEKALRAVPVGPFAWAPDSEHLLYGNAKQALWLLNVNNDGPRLFYTLDVERTFGSGSRASVAALDFAPDGSFVVIALSLSRTIDQAWTGVTVDAITTLLKRR